MICCSRFLFLFLEGHAPRLALTRKSKRGKRQCPQRTQQYEFAQADYSETFRNIHRNLETNPPWRFRAILLTSRHGTGRDADDRQGYGGGEGTFAAVFHGVIVVANIPPALVGVVAPIIAEAYTHAQLDSLFHASGFPGDPPEGNKVHKCQDWMRRANRDIADSLPLLGRLLAEYIDGESEFHTEGRQKILAAITREGLAYNRGGFLLGANLTGPSRSLGERLKADGVGTLNLEYQRAYDHIERDPNAALTAACAILESVCTYILEESGQALPKDRSLKPLWNAIAGHLGLSPGAMADDDIKRILSGLYSITDGIAALRTHEGSAHGRSNKSTYRVTARHARLAVHAAHTVAHFVLETWDDRRSQPPS
jgi:hypothetical protein